MAIIVSILSRRLARFLALLSLALAVALLGAACGNDDDLILATTTSVDDSGLLDVLVPIFEERSGVNVKVIAVGTGAALRLARDGNADALFVHAPAAEKALTEAGALVDRHLVAYNDFLIAGPPADPAGVAGSTDAAASLRRIAAARATFISRGDDSGTHTKERALWTASGIEPGGRWYQETGQGMGASLIIASQKRAYILTDRATFLALSAKLELAPVVEGDPLLVNLYSVMRADPAQARVNADAGAAWVEFMLADEIQSLIAGFGREEFGRPLFFPAAGKSEAEAINEFVGATTRRAGG